jgi:hypothetical protein
VIPPRIKRPIISPQVEFLGLDVQKSRMLKHQSSEEGNLTVSSTEYNKAEAREA